MTEYAQPPRDNTLRNLVIAVAVLIVICCCCIALLLLIVTLLGPTVGGVFSDVVQGLEMTPAP